MAQPEDRESNESDYSIDSDVEFEFSEGIPQVEDGFIQKYLQGRQALIEQEEKQRHGTFLCLLHSLDALFKSQDLSQVRCILR